MNTGRIVVGWVALVAVAGCATHAPAPVAERAAAVEVEAPTAMAVAAAAAPVETKSAALYSVKKGDTLYRIALDHGQDHKDLVAWNNIENPNRIEVGRQLRVTPPETAAPVAVAKPVVTAAPVEAKTAGGNSDDYKREPRGGKVTYSDQALARMREGDAATKEMPAQAKPAEKPTEKPAEKPVAQSVGDEAIDWGWPAGGKVQTAFADNPGKEANKGIDVAGKVGEPVLAAASGTVTLVSSSLRGYGNLVVVKHNPTYLSVYAHNSKILVKEGQPVKMGQKIAEIGSSDADSPKLHFEIRRMGKPVDPTKYLPARP